MENQAARMFVFCDNHKSAAPVTDFVCTADGWREDGRDSSVRVTIGAQSGLGIVLIGPDFGRKDVYTRYEFRCPRRNCGRAVVAKDAKLYPILDEMAARGESRVSLSELAANV